MGLRLELRLLICNTSRSAGQGHALGLQGVVARCDAGPGAHDPLRVSLARTLVGNGPVGPVAPSVDTQNRPLIDT